MNPSVPLGYIPIFLRAGIGRGLLLSATLVGLGGCFSTEVSEEEGDTSSSGSAPVITNLVLTPSYVAQGKSAPVTGEFEFTDREGDLAEFTLTLSQGGAQTTTARSPVQNHKGQTSGKGIFAAAILGPRKGAMEVSLTLFDAQGNASNVFPATLNVQ